MAPPRAESRAAGALDGVGANAVAGILLLVNPLALVLGWHGYSPMHPESLVCGALLVGVGTALGLLMAAGVWIRIALSALLLAWWVDVATPGATGAGILVGSFAASAVVAWSLRRHLTRVLVAVGSATLVATTVQAAFRSETPDVDPSTREASATNPPPLVHIVLDEQIGIEGIPAEFDPRREVAGRLRDLFLDRDFRVFGRAYSVFYDTHFSMAHLLNFGRHLEARRYFARPFEEGDSIAENAYFEALARRGYRIRVYQPDYIDYCGTSPAVASCFTYPLESMAVLEDAPLATGEKSKLILAMFARYSNALQHLRVAYTAMAEAAAGVPLPTWHDSERVSAISAMRALERVREDVAGGGQGDAFFVHLLLPHYPYAYDANCLIRPRASQWLQANHEPAAPRRNTPDSRDRRYPLYLDQVRCTAAKLEQLLDEIAASPPFADATIVVQGDHGSRIDLGPPRPRYVQNLPASVYLDGYTTLFAVRQPGRERGYDRRVLSVDALLRAVMRSEDVPEEDAVPVVALVNLAGTQQRVRTLPRFGHGIVR